MSLLLPIIRDIKEIKKIPIYHQKVMRKNYTLRTLALLLLCIMAANVSGQSTLYGTVSYHNDGIRVLQDVDVLLYDDNGTLVATTTTNSNGYYQFQNLPEGTYTLTGSCDLEPGGVDVVSALLVLHHIIGIQPLEGMALLAADVNADGAITMSDYLIILIHHLVFGNPFPIGDWVFEETTVTLNNLKSETQKGVGGSSAGDTGGAFDPGTLQSPINFYAGKENIQSYENTKLTVALKVAEATDLTAMNLYLSYPSNLVEIIEINSEFSDFEYTVNQDQIVLSAANHTAQDLSFNAGDEILTIKLRTLDHFSEDHKIQFSLLNKSHFANAGLKLVTPSVTLPAITYKEEQSHLMQNYPNPFSLNTTVSYHLAKPAKVNISVYAIDGSLAKVLVDDYQAKGNYRIDYNKGSLTPGTYLLQMKTGEKNPVQDTRVMIITSD
jgi:hypothetical protein